MTLIPLSSNTAVRDLVRAATPVLRISGLGDSKWRREMKVGDPRIGPWHASVHEVLDRETWFLNGECLYFLTDCADRIRYVGESKNRLRDRWRTPPAICASTGAALGNPYLFHNRAWPHLERSIKAKDGLAPFTVSVLHLAKLGNLVAAARELAALPTLAGDGRHLAKVVQDWICAQTDQRDYLWNVAGLASCRAEKATNRTGRP